MPEPITIDVFPCWERQSDEPLEKFLLFEGFFLPLPKANLMEAYRRYQSDMGRNGHINSVPTAWRDDCERYQWRDRHAVYRRSKNQENLSWIEQERRELAESELDISKKLMAKASQILEMAIDPENTSLKDATALARAASELGRAALSWDNLDKAFDTIQRAGFQVILPEHLRGLYVPKPPHQTQNALPQSGGD